MSDPDARPQAAPTNSAPAPGAVGEKRATTPKAAVIARAPQPAAEQPKTAARAPEPVEALDLVRLPAAGEVSPGDPQGRAPAPGSVPAGDSRSLRRGRAGAPERFALVYRDGTFLVSRQGIVGREGDWRVIEYPTVGAAAHAYANECARLIADGFVDYALRSRDRQAR